MDYSKYLVDTWNTNHKVTAYLLENIETDWLTIKQSDQGRSIGQQFVHINNIRSYWIGKVGQKEDLKIDKKYANDKGRLLVSLNLTSDKMSMTLQSIFMAESIKGYNPDPIAFYTQMVAHEAHHRGQIMMTISRSKLPIAKTVNFGLWNWNNK